MMGVLGGLCVAVEGQFAEGGGRYQRRRSGKELPAGEPRFRHA
jgi:hypothetical protein